MDFLLTGFWGAILRMAQAVIEASPTVVCGLLVAAIFERMLGPKNVLRLFGGNTWSSMPRAWFLGILLPVCSLGVFPILREMRKSGCSGGTIFAFALAGPLFNPISFFYGLTLSEPLVIFSFMFCSLIIVTLVGIVWDWLYPGSALPPPAEDTAIAPGLKRMLGVMVAAGRDAVGPTVGYMLVALLGVGLLSAVLPFGSLQHTMQHDNWISPLLMAAVALPAYDSPMKAMMQLGLLFEHGNSVGAALTLLILGAGMNLATILWIKNHYGTRRTLGWLALVVGSVLVLSYIANTPLDFAENREGHTHAFDDFACPFQDGMSGHLAAQIWPRLEEETHTYLLAGLMIWGFLIGVGLFVRVLERFVNVDAWLESRGIEPSQMPFYYKPLPGWLLGLVALMGLIALSVVGCYIYYPAPEVAFKEMSYLKSDAGAFITSGNKEAAKRELRRMLDYTRRLEIGVMLREGKLSDDAKSKSDRLRGELEKVYDAINDSEYGNTEPERQEVMQIFYRGLNKAYNECKQAYSAQ